MALRLAEADSPGMVFVLEGEQVGWSVLVVVIGLGLGLELELVGWSVLQNCHCSRPHRRST